MKCPICRLHEIADNLKTKEEIRHTCVEHHRKIYAEKVAASIKRKETAPLRRANYGSQAKTLWFCFMKIPEGGRV